uniref:Cyclic nucleotide-binding domain-containing protein n=1 Tax=Panagrolaimus superbus TaxID=310955 RepID=A0A914XX12_9BILA
MENQEHGKVESYLLRANKADLIVKYYRDQEMWPDALRIAREFVPDALQTLQKQFDEYQLKSGAKGAYSYMAQAKDWESQGDYRRAIETYLKVEEPITADQELIADANKRAGELVAKFMVGEEAATLLEQIGERLVELGHGQDAGELLLLGNRPQAAVHALLASKEWAKAKRVATELAPELEQLVDETYRDFLKNQGRIGDLIDVDVISAIDILIERGNWEKALETAKQQNVSMMKYFRYGTLQKIAPLLNEQKVI